MATLPKLSVRAALAVGPGSPMTPQELLEQLAGRHPENLRWLRRRLGSTVPDGDVEDVLQSAYTRALVALGNDRSAPAFDDLQRAQAWLRTIALNQALDIERRRRGRPRHGCGGRPDPVPLDESESPSLAERGAGVEDEVLDSLERDTRQRQIAEAIATLDARHRQVLQLRYGRDLDPAAIMVLEGLNRRQWEGRHTRAVKALGRALARLPVGSECARTRRLLRRPADLLGHGSAPAVEHVAGCVACGAFARSAQYAMVTLPLPLAIAAWRYEAMDRLVGSRAVGRAQSAGGDPGASGLGGACAAGAKLATMAVAVVGALGLVADDLVRIDSAPTAAKSAVPGIGTGAGLDLAAHDTPAQALERAAREMARRQARARRAAGVPVSRSRAPRITAPVRAATAHASPTDRDGGDLK